MNESPAIYVGTYRKYNEGSLFGAWLNLDDYSDQSEFYEAATKLHSNESDPELMFQDWENIPSQFIGESYIAAEYWDYLDAINNSHLDEAVFKAAADLDIDYNMVEELYEGEYSSDEDFAQCFAENIGSLDENASWPNNCIDWERAARDLMFDYGESDGHYFRTSY